MEPTVISETIQEFNGKRYYLCGRYFQRKGRRLHVAIWEFVNGPTPHGWHVHHKDENRSNNALSNLQSMPGSDHISLHGQTPTQIQRTARSFNRAKATEGNLRIPKEQRALAAQAGWQRATKKWCICKVCSTPFESFMSTSFFCSPACRQKDLRQRRKAEREMGT